GCAGSDRGRAGRDERWRGRGIEDVHALVRGRGARRDEADVDQADEDDDAADPQQAGAVPLEERGLTLRRAAGAANGAGSRTRTTGGPGQEKPRWCRKEVGVEVCQITAGRATPRPPGRECPG